MGFSGWLRYQEDRPLTEREQRRTEIEKDVAIRLGEEFLNGHWKIEGVREQERSDFSNFEQIDHRHFESDFELDIAGNMISFFNGPTFQAISISMLKARSLVLQIMEIIERVAKDKDPNFFKRPDFESAVKDELDVYNK